MIISYKLRKSKNEESIFYKMSLQIFLSTNNVWEKSIFVTSRPSVYFIFLQCVLYKLPNLKILFFSFNDTQFYFIVLVYFRCLDFTTNDTGILCDTHNISEVLFSSCFFDMF